MVDERDPDFSFSLSDKRGLFIVGEGISSTEVAGKAVLVVSVPIEMTEADGVTEEPFPVMSTDFFLMLDNGSSFFDLIFAYISLLNLVVISARRKHL